MQMKEYLKWNNRISAAYAVGVWTLMGTLGYLTYTGKYDQIFQNVKEEKVEPDENTVVYTTPHTKTVIIYKKDFVPYTTRIYNFLRSFSAEPPKTESDSVQPGETENYSRRV